MPTVKKQTRKKTTRKKPASKKSGAIGKIKPLGFDGDDGIKMNLYGRSGTGKTTLWSTFPGKILALVCSGGDKPGELRSINTPENRKKISSVIIEDSDEFKEIIEHQEETGEFATLVMDHATGLQDLILKEILGLSEIPAQKSWGLATQQQYGQVALQTKERLRSLLNLSCNVVIIAQEREFNTDNESELLMPYVGSALTPSVTGWLNPACDYICQTFIRSKTVKKKVKIAGKTIERDEPTTGVEYCLRTAPDPVFTTKFRLPKREDLPEVIVDPTYDKIVKLIQGRN